VGSVHGKVGQILHDQLHWLDVTDRVVFKPAVTVHQFLNGRAPPYLSEHCIPVSSADTRRHLRSANRYLLAVPRFRLNTYGHRAFSVAGPTAWNSLPDFILDPRAAQTVLAGFSMPATGHIAAATYRMTLDHTGYSLYFTIKRENGGDAPKYPFSWEIQAFT